MTNNREEQIRNKAKELGQQYFPDSSNIWARSNIEAVYVENACVEMAEWIDQHPNWISVDDGLPPHRNQTNHKFENDFSVSCFVSNGKDVDTGYYDHRLRKWNCEFLTNVVYWYCPQPPRKEE